MIAGNIMRQRWTKLGAVVCVVAGLLVVVLGVVGVKTLAHSKAGKRASSLPPAQSLPDTPAALLAVKADTGALTALVVLAKAPAGADGKSRGGSLIPFPVGSGVQVGDNPQLNRLAELYLAGGVNALASQAGSLLSLNFSVVAEVDAAAMAGLLGPAGTVSVRQAAGVQQMGPAAAATLLATQTTHLEAAHFESTVGYWTDLAHRVGKGLSFTGSQTNGAITRFFDSILSGPITVHPLRGATVPQGPTNPLGGDVYKLDQDQVTRLMALLLPNAFSPVDLQFTVRLLNPTGDANLTLAAIARIRKAGGGVTIVDETKGSLPTKTEFSLSGRLERADVKTFGATFGAYTYVAVGQAGSRHMRYADIDVTIALGAGFPQVAGAKSG